MSSPSAPPAPDYEAAARVTAEGNKEAAILAQIGNMTNQVGPKQYDANGKEIGSNRVTYVAQNYNKDGSINTKNPGQWTQKIILGGNDQRLFNESQQVNLGLSDLSLQGVRVVGDALKKPIAQKFDLSNNAGTTADQMTTSVDVPEFNGQIADSGQIQNNIENAGQIQGQIANAGQIQTNVDSAGRIQNNIANAGRINGGIANAGNINSNANANNQAVDKLQNNSGQIQTGVNFQSVSGDVRNNAGQIKTNLGIDPQLLGQQTTDALYKANTQYLDPQFQQSQNALESKLANQGITQGSEAYNNAMREFGMQKQQAYESARNTAVGGGINAAQGMFGMGLQGAQFQNNSLGQQFGQNLSAAQLAQQAQTANNANALAAQQARNSALGQQFGQDLTANQNTNSVANQNNATNLANTGFTNAAQAQQFGQNKTVTDTANSAQAQRYVQNTGDSTFRNAAQQQAYNQNLADAAFTNSAQAQQNAQNAQDANFANAAQSQQFGQNTANANFANAAQGQTFAQNSAQTTAENEAAKNTFNANLSNANMNNEALSQLFGQNFSNSQLNNSASVTDLQQQQALQQAPINILNSVRSGAQMQTANIPQVAVSQPGQLANWQGADMLGAAQAKGQYDQGIYNAQSAANSSLISGVMGMGGMLGGAAITSDIRLKKDVIRIGTHKTLGVGLYLWNYLWGEKGAGVMAQELETVMPKAVITMPDGFKAVNYSMLGA
jgi:hypothetical protein